MKNLKKTLACLLSVAMVAGLSALSASAGETVKVEAETGTPSTAGVTIWTAENDSSIGADVSGASYVGGLGGDDTVADKGFVELTLTSPAAGEATIKITYFSGQDRSVDVIVNDGAAVNIATPTAGGWNTGAGTATGTITLKEGENTIKLGNATAWAPNVDYIEVTLPDAPAGDEDSSVTPPETGDATLVAVAVAVVALAGVAVVAKKRHTAE